MVKVSIKTKFWDNSKYDIISKLKQDFNFFLYVGFIFFVLSFFFEQLLYVYLGIIMGYMMLSFLSMRKWLNER